MTHFSSQIFCLFCFFFLFFCCLFCFVLFVFVVCFVFVAFSCSFFWEGGGWIPYSPTGSMTIEKKEEEEQENGLGRDRCWC